jgi:exosome complex component RRP42
MDIDQDTISGFDTRQVQTATDFELPDYWDEGEVLDGRQHWPVCITLNLVKTGKPLILFSYLQLTCSFT